MGSGQPKRAAYLTLLSQTVQLGGFGTDAELAEAFATCTLQTHLVTPRGIDNDEDGAPVRVCRGLVRSWDESWPALRRLA